MFLPGPFFAAAASASIANAFCPRVVGGSCTSGGGSGEGGEGIGASGSSHYRMTKGWEDVEEKEDVEERRGILISFSDRPRH